MEVGRTRYGPSFNIDMYIHTFTPLHVYTSESSHLVSLVPFWALRFVTIRASGGGRNYMLGTQMKTGARGKPPSSERWPCLVCRWHLRLFTPSLRRRPGGRVQGQRQSKQCSETCSRRFED